MADYEIPEVTGEEGILDIPKLQPDAMKGHGMPVTDLDARGM